jgi:hypothetical protein
MEFGNQYYYEKTIQQRHRELLRETESLGLLKQAGLLPKKRIAWPMVKVNLTALWCMIRRLAPLVHKP